MRVLIIDDDEILCEMFRVFLKDIDCYLKIITDGQEALQFLDTYPPDVLITDINLPSINGLDIIKHARGRLGMDGLQIIVITANAIAARHPDLKFVDEVIKKPVTRTEFTAAVKRAIERSKPKPEETSSAQIKSKSLNGN